MRNTHNTFPLPEFSEREHRLMFEASPERVSGPEIREEQQRIKESEVIVVSKLGQVTQLDDDKRRLLYEDVWTRFMLEASVQMEGGKRVQWVPPGLMATAEQWHPAFKGANERFTEIKDRSPKHATALLDSLKQQLEDWKSALEEYDTAFGTSLQNDLAAAGVDVDVKATLEAYIRDQKTVVERMDAVLARMREALAETDASRAVAVSLIRDKIAAARAKGESVTALEAELAYAELAPTDKIKKLEQQWKEQVSISVADREKLKKVVDTLKQKLNGINEDERVFLRAHAEPRRNYLLKFGGYNAEWLLGQAETETAGTYNARLLEIDLKVLGFTPDIAELEARKADKNALIAYIKSLKAIDPRDGKEVRFLDNGAGISLNDMYLRSQLPIDVVRQLQRPDLQGVSTALLYELLTLDPNKTFDENLPALLKICTVEEGGLTVLRQDRFIQIATLLLHTKAGADAHETFNAAEPDATKHQSFKKDAEAFLQKLIDGGTLKRGSDSRIIINAPAGTKPEDHLIAALKAEGFTWSPDTLQMIKDMKAIGVDTRKLGVTVDMLWDEAKTTGANAGRVWWNYIRSLPNLVYDPEQDPAIAEFIKKQDALDAAIGAIEDGTGAFDDVEAFFGKAKEMLEGSEKTKRDALEPIDVAADARRHFDAASTLTDAAVFMVKKLNEQCGWDQRPLEIRKISFWLAMNKGEGGLDMAVRFLNDASAVERDPDSRQAFINAYIEDLPEADRTALQKYLGTFNRVQELSRTDILAEAKNRDIHVKRDALMVLTTLGHAGKLGRWHIDDPAKEPYIEESLRAIMVGNGADAVIRTFIEKKPHQYEFNGVQHTIAVEDANLYVRQIQNDLIYKSQQEVSAEKQNKEYELLQDPMEKGLRGLAETLGEMWQGDTVDKAKVIAAVVAGIWLMRSAWQKGGLGKKLLVGLPLLMVANTVYKRQTGKDLLGQHLTFMSKEQRGTALERFRRRGAAIDKYDVLGTNAGHAALQQLTSRSNPIRVEELLAWREQVKAKGHRDYKEGAPAGLNVMAIWQHMGSKSEMNDAYEVAFLAFEALCVDVAQLNGMGGDYESIAEQGADFIKTHYVDMTEYHPDDPRRDLAKMPITMLDVIINEARTPGSADAVTEDRAFVEWLADSIGKSTDYVYGKLKQGYTYAQIKKEEIGEAIPEYWEAGKEFVIKTYEDVEEWARITYAKVKPEIIEQYKATFRFIVETGKDIGLTIITKGPDLIEWGVSGAYGIGARGFHKLREVHAHLLLHPELNWLESFENFVLETFGLDLRKELSEKQARDQIAIEISALAGMYNGGSYGMRDVTNEFSISPAMGVERSSRLVFVEDIASGKPLTFDAVKSRIEQEMRNLAKTVFDIDIAPAEKIEDKLKPNQARFLMEIIQRNLSRNVASADDVRRVASEHQRNVADLEERVRALGEQAAHKLELRRDNEHQLREITPDFEAAWKTDVATLDSRLDLHKEQRDTQRQKLLSLTEKLRQLTDELRTGIANNTLNAASRFLLERKITGVESDKAEALRSFNEHHKEVAKLYVYKKIAALPVANRNPAGAAAISFSDADAKEVLPDHLRGDAAMIAQSLQNLRNVLRSAISTHASHENLERTLEIERTAYAALERDFSRAKQELAHLKTEGTAPVILDEGTLFRDVGKPDVLRLGLPGNKAVLFDQVFAEPYNLNELIPMDWMLGDAREAAEKVVRAWKVDRMNGDPALKKFKEKGGNPDIVGVYERYLEHVAIGEIFVRGMIESPDGGEGEKENPLHLALHEARRLDEYLRERGKLVTFAQFLDLWESMPEDSRNKYLP